LYNEKYKYELVFQRLIQIKFLFTKKRKGFLDEDAHFPGYSRAQIVRQLEGVLNGKAGRVPHFLKL